MSKHENAPTAEEFDAYTKEDERKALEAIHKQTEVKTMVKGDTFWALAPGGKTYKLPMFLSINQFKRLSEATDTDSIDTIVEIVRVFAGDKDADELLNAPIQTVMDIMNRFGEMIYLTQGADWGKSDGSSSSSEAGSTEA